MATTAVRTQFGFQPYPAPLMLGRPSRSASPRGDVTPSRAHVEVGRFGLDLESVPAGRRSGLDRQKLQLPELRYQAGDRGLQLFKRMGPNPIASGPAGEIREAVVAPEQTAPGRRDRQDIDRHLNCTRQLRYLRRRGGAAVSIPSVMTMPLGVGSAGPQAVLPSR